MNEMVFPNDPNTEIGGRIKCGLIVFVAIVPG